MPRQKVDTNHSNTIDPILELQKNPLEESETETVLARSPRHKIFLSRLKRKILKHVYLVRVLLLLTIMVGLVFLGTVAWKLVTRSQVGFYLSLTKDFIFTPSEKISAIEGRTNILILGKGGSGHEGPDLTDTILFASLKEKPAFISLISLPRDIWITQLRTKLNSVYYWGNQKQPPVQRTSGPEETGGGLILAKSTVEEVLGQPVQYGIVIDFSGFKEIIDVLGGIDVDVQNSFTDNDFPIAGRENDLCGGDPTYRCRYESITFNKGLQKMGGETALKFVRSRHAEGDEGTDLARAARQEQVITAIKNKVLSREILLNLGKLVALKAAVLESIETDITPETAAILARWFLEGRENINSTVLSEELLDNPPKLPKYDNLYVFIPKEIDESKPGGRSWAKVQEWVECVLEVSCN